MHGYLSALLVATAATAVLTFARADVVVPRSATPNVEVEAAVTASTPAVRFATVTKPYGASVRAAPSLEAPGLFNAACGETLPVISTEEGWVQVRTEAGIGWIGSGRVAAGAVAPATDCTGQRFLYETAEARARVATECLAVKVRPFDGSAALACVAEGHQFSIVDGPFDPGLGEDWFKVTSATTGTGWVQAEHLFPLSGRRATR